MHWFTAQSWQPLRFGRSLLRSRALHYVATLMIISQRSPSEFLKIYISILYMRVGIKFVSNWLHICLFCVWDVGCATANQHSRFNQLTNRSVWFNSCSYASLPCETTSVFNHFKSPCWSKKLKASSSVMNLVPPQKNPKISGKSIIQKSFCVLYDQRRVPSMWSAVLASSVLGTFLSPIVECTMANNAPTQNITSTEEKR